MSVHQLPDPLEPIARMMGPVDDLVAVAPGLEVVIFGAGQHVSIPVVGWAPVKGQHRPVVPWAGRLAAVVAEWTPEATVRIGVDPQLGCDLDRIRDSLDRVAKQVGYVAGALVEAFPSDMAGPSWNRAPTPRSIDAAPATATVPASPPAPVLCRCHPGGKGLAVAWVLEGDTVDALVVLEDGPHRCPAYSMLRKAPA